MSSDRKHDQEYIENYKEGLRESVEFFSNKKKPEREAWVVIQLLNYLGIRYVSDEVRPSDDEPLDVYFRDARFQVKEILDTDRKRHDEYKDLLEKAENVSDPKELLEHYTPKNITINEIYRIVAKRAQDYMLKYGKDVRCTLNMVFYVNLQDYGVTGTKLSVETEALQSQGWGVCICSNK